MSDFNAFYDNFITDSQMFKVFEEKYRYEINFDGEKGNKNISIFLNWIWLFEALSDLEQLSRTYSKIVESDFKEASPNYQKIYDLFMRLNVDRAIFSYEHEINFELFHVFKCSLERYDQEKGGATHFQFLTDLETYSLIGLNFPVKQCLFFFTIFIEQLLIQKGLQSSRRNTRHKKLLKHQQHVQNIFFRYGSFYALNVTYRFCFGHSGFVKVQDLIVKIENQIVSDSRLLKAEFNLEDDGQQGCMLNCVLIYSAQAMRDASSCIYQLEQIAENFKEQVEIKFENWGRVLSHIFQLELSGLIDTPKKLHDFLYWIVGLFYRHDDFFSYRSKMVGDGGYQHKQVKEAWTLGLNSFQSGMYKELMDVDYAEVMKSIADSSKVWSTAVLSNSLQRRLSIDQIILSEIRYDLGFNEKLHRDILYCMQVFYTFCQISTEPFFLFETRSGIVTQVQLSRVGKQLIFLFNLLCQTPHIFSDLKKINVLLANYYQDLLDSQLWHVLEKLDEKGVAAILDIPTFVNLNLLLERMKNGGELGAYIPGFYSSDDQLRHTIEDLVFFDKRTSEAQEYVGALLRTDQLVCRVKFYAKIEDMSFLDTRNIFSAHFTKFLRIHKRRNLLRCLSGYFLIWLGNEFEHTYVFKEENPYVDVVFFIKYEYGFNYENFKSELLTAWQEFKEKKMLLGGKSDIFGMTDLKYEHLMHSIDALNSSFVIVEKSDKKMKRLVVEKLLPYFTYRHFYLPQTFKDGNVKSGKIFTKGTIKVKKK